MNPRSIEVSIIPCPERRSDEAAAFLRRVFYEELGFTPDPRLDKDFSGLVAHYRRGRGELWIATANDRIVATTALLDLTAGSTSAGQAQADPAARGGDAELKRMFVDREARGLGLGRRLLAEALNRAKAMAFDRVVLDTKLDMRAAIGLYRSAGFEEIPDYNGNRRADVFMALRM